MLKKTIKDAQELARKKKGKCLSRKYVNSEKKLIWRCHRGHKWPAVFRSIKSGSWCPDCGGKKRKSLKDAQILAKKKKGKCLPKKYINAHTRMEWECSEGHQWITTYNCIQQGQWCPYCSKTRKLSIKYAHNLAKKNGGKCLSKKYINAHAKMKWQCSEGHQWLAPISNISSMNRWCPSCSMNITESMVRDLFHLNFKVSFPKQRLIWLRNSRGNIMELDGYNPDLNIAFEFHGRQHYKEVLFFHRKGNTLDRRKQDDLLKHKLCSKKGIKLIPIWEYELEKKSLVEVFIEKLKQNKLPINLTHSSIERLRQDIGYSHTRYSKLRLHQAESTAKKVGGKCLSKKYVNVRTKMKWACVNGHRWKNTFYHVVMEGQWCPSCARVRKHTLKDVKKLALKKGGRCLSKEYINGHAPMKWECAKGHQWMATFLSVQSKTWCPDCGGSKRKTLKDAINLAKEHRYKCLSKKYTNAHLLMRWKCSKGHEWKASYSNIRAGKGCSKCAGRGLTIADLQMLGRAHGCISLSKRYINRGTKLKWKCRKGHIFFRSLLNIRQTKWWCPMCTRYK